MSNARDEPTLDEIKARLSIPDAALLLGLDWKPGKSCASPFRPDKEATGHQAATGGVWKCSSRISMSSPRSASAMERRKESGIMDSSSSWTWLNTALQRVLQLAAEGSIKKVLVHEVSRVARRPSVALTFVEMLETHCVSLYWHAQAIETLLANCKRNPAAAIMLALLSEMARAEKETLVDRIKSGLAEARRNGQTLGRPKGTTLETADFLAKHKDIQKLLKSGQSVRNAAKITGKGASTVQRVKAAMAA